MNTEWKEINPDYIVSSDGQVGSRKYGKFRVLRPIFDGSGYPNVVLFWGGTKRMWKIHILVAEAFLGPKPSPKHEVNHKNGDKTDARDSNLEWVTRLENMRHYTHVLGHRAARGEASGRAKVTEADVREIRRRCAAGEFQRVVGADYGLTQGSVGLIVRQVNWAWLK